MQIDNRYYRLALMYAKRRELSLAAGYAGHALRLNPQNQRAGTLLGLCLYELGELGEADELQKKYPLLSDPEEYACLQAALGEIKELARRKKWRKAAAIARELSHQNVRVLSIQGCLWASCGRYRKAAFFFVEVLKKDRGNRFALDCLAEVVNRREPFWLRGFS